MDAITQIHVDQSMFQAEEGQTDTKKLDDFAAWASLHPKVYELAPITDQTNWQIVLVVPELSREDIAQEIRTWFEEYDPKDSRRYLQ